MSPSLPKTYKAAVIEQNNAPLTIKDLPLKEPQDGQILVKVKACGVCHSDEIVRAGMMGTPPIVPGHEVIGEVVALGPREKKWKVGDSVGGPWHGGHDGVCRQCNRGLFQMCDNEAINGVTQDGGYAEYVLLRSEAAVRIPQGIDAVEAAPLLCAGVTVFNAIRQVKVLAGGTVAIQGLGGLGHLALQYSRKMGYRTVALSRDATKKDFATKLGATDYIDSSQQNTAEALQKIGGADLIVVTAPNPEIMGDLINGCAAGGTVIILAPVGEIKVNTIPMIGKGISVRGWPSGHALDAEEAIAFAQTHGVHCMVEKFPLSQANEAFEHMLSGKVRFRAVLTME
ncbi:Alcohol dehydrogenase superfamily zinc-containing [Macrophomina phaseolina MS6]|uniref:Alcohol dehydrogenase superfamily zinc-containing n=1 Tax=Macrophomina phaseolina (strain MS6) TaxID=1126212 RepID=K2S1J6_MACPH|nr:Alcohol dehydrogenase superfamily zinc-containing [Macrophomina phaseolina MS6]